MRLPGRPWQADSAAARWDRLAPPRPLQEHGHAQGSAVPGSTVPSAGLVLPPPTLIRGSPFDRWAPSAGDVSFRCFSVTYTQQVQLPLRAAGCSEQGMSKPKASPGSESSIGRTNAWLCSGPARPVAAWQGSQAQEAEHGAALPSYTCPMWPWDSRRQHREEEEEFGSQGCQGAPRAAPGVGMLCRAEDGTFS